MKYTSRRECGTRPQCLMQSVERPELSCARVEVETSNPGPDGSLTFHPSGDLRRAHPRSRSPRSPRWTRAARPCPPAHPQPGRGGIPSFLRNDVRNQGVSDEEMVTYLWSASTMCCIEFGVGPLACLPFRSVTTLLTSRAPLRSAGLGEELTARGRAALEVIRHAHNRRRGTGLEARRG